MTRSPHPVAAALAQFDCSPDAAPSLHHAGENVTYQVHAGGAPYALRFYRPGKWTAAQVREEHAACRLAATCGAPVPCSTSAATTYLESYRAALFPWHPGSPPALLGPRYFEALGRLAAELHTALGPLRRGTCRPGHTPETLLHQPRRRLAETGFSGLGPGGPLSAATAAVAQRWESLAPQVAYLHGDLHSANLLRSGAELTPLDFDGCGVGPVAYELATAFAEARQRPDAEALLAGLLAAYGAAAPGKEEVRLFGWVRELAALSWVLDLEPFPYPEGPAAFAQATLAELLAQVDRVAPQALTV